MCQTREKREKLGKGENRIIDCKFKMVTSSNSNLGRNRERDAACGRNVWASTGAYRNWATTGTSLCLISTACTQSQAQAADFLLSKVVITLVPGKAFLSRGARCDDCAGNTDGSRVSCCCGYEARGAPFVMVSQANNSPCNVMHSLPSIVNTGQQREGGPPIKPELRGRPMSNCRRAGACARRNRIFGQIDIRHAMPGMLRLKRPNQGCSFF